VVAAGIPPTNLKGETQWAQILNTIYQTVKNTKDQLIKMLKEKL